MTQTATHNEPILTGGVRGQYLGVETTLRFSAVDQELNTLSSGCGVFEMNWRALIRITGKDRVRWLHNMVTNNVRDLELNRGAYNFVLNAQGRILADLCVFNRGELLLLETDRGQVETLLTTLRRFIIMDKVELADLGNELTVIGVAGPGSVDTLAASGFKVEDMQHLEILDTAFGDAAVQIIRGGTNKPYWFELWSDRAHSAAIAAHLSRSGAQPVGVEALELWRILHGIPQYGKDIRDRDLPQETGQTQALNFNKGCYVGQEIVERIRSRGQVHRKLTGFDFGGAAPAIGKFEVDGRTFAEITSVAHIPSESGAREIGLGYVRVESVPENRVLDLNGVKATVVELPFGMDAF